MKYIFSKIMLNCVGYITVAGFSFYLGGGQKFIVWGVHANVEQHQEILFQTDTPSEQTTFEKKVSALTDDLVRVEQYNRNLTLQLSANKEPVTTVRSEQAVNEGRCSLLTGKLNSSLYETAYSGIQSVHFETREKSLMAMAKLGTPEAKAVLMSVVMNEHEHPELRRTLVRTIDWRGSIEQAVNLLSSTDDALKAAVILSAQDSHFDGVEQEVFKNKLMELFNDGHSSFIQISAVNYLANKDPAAVLKINLLSSDPEVYNAVNEHINELSLGF